MSEQITEPRRISAKELLSLPTGLRPKLLREKAVELKVSDDLTMTFVVRQLTKSLTAFLNQRVLENMPTPPMIEQRYDSMHTDPISGKPRRPGTYREQNPEDPKYKQELEVWFNEACVWLAVLSAGDDFGVTVSNVDDKLVEISELLPTPVLLQLAIEAARVNEGLNLADQLLLQVRRNEEILAEFAEYEELQRQYQEAAATSEE